MNARTSPQQHHRDSEAPKAPEEKEEPRVSPPSVLSLLGVLVAPKRLLSSLSKEKRQELYRRAAETEEACGDDRTKDTR